MKKSAGLLAGLCVLVMALSLASPALAQNYLVLNGGLYSPQNEKLYDFDSGFNGELAFGRYFNKNLALEVASGYFKTRATKTADVASAEATLDFNLVPLTGALRAIIPLGAFELYGIGGGGLFCVDGLQCVDQQSIRRFLRQIQPDPGRRLPGGRRQRQGLAHGLPRAGGQIPLDHEPFHGQPRNGYQSQRHPGDVESGISILAVFGAAGENSPAAHSSSGFFLN